MMKGWKQRLVGGIALTAAIVLGSTVAATSTQADSGWSWEGAFVGAVIGGLIGPAIDHEHDRRGSVGVSTTRGAFYDGPLIVYRHHGGWNHQPWRHQRKWEVRLGHQRPWRVHPPRYHHRQWLGPRIHLRLWYAHPPRHQYRQWHGPRVHQQPRYVHPPQHQHRHWQKQRAHQPPRHAQVQRHYHGHGHNW